MSEKELQIDPEVDVAIVGISGRFPGGADVNGFWDTLLKGRSGVVDVPFADAQTRYAGTGGPGGGHYVRRKGVLESAHAFAAGFFGLSVDQASRLDPQIRLLLESGWCAFEDAGINIPDVANRTGTFISVGSAASGAAGLGGFLESGDLLDFETAAFAEKDAPACYLAYKLGLSGPAYSIQCFCSSALVAIHNAVQSIRSLETDVALVGAAYIDDPDNPGYKWTPNSFLSENGTCYAFDARANGTPLGNGGGVVILRRLSAAIAARNPIYCVVRGTAVNNDGGKRLSFFAPTVAGQTAVIQEALANAGVGPGGISYVEAHGTGTAVGDPIEVAALDSACSGGGGVYLGSNKPNFGHLDRASGIASVLKVALACERRIMPPTINYLNPNPRATQLGRKFQVLTSPKNLSELATPFRAGISAFGVGGTNAHIVVEQPPQVERSIGQNRLEVFPISARNAEELSAAVANLAVYLQRHDDISLQSVAWTLQSGRKQFPVRAAFVADSVGELRHALLGFTAAAAAGRKTAGNRYYIEYSGMDETLESWLEKEYAGSWQQFVEKISGGLLADTDAAKSPRAALTRLFCAYWVITDVLIDFGINPSSACGDAMGRAAYFLRTQPSGGHELDLRRLLECVDCDRVFLEVSRETMRDLAPHVERSQGLATIFATGVFSGTLLEARAIARLLGAANIPFKMRFTVRPPAENESFEKNERANSFLQMLSDSVGASPDSGNCLRIGVRTAFGDSSSAQMGQAVNPVSGEAAVMGARLTKTCADLWGKGGDFDWKRLWRGPTPSLVRLPAYPLVRMPIPLRQDEPKAKKSSVTGEVPRVEAWRSIESAPVIAAAATLICVYDDEDPASCSMCDLLRRCKEPPGLLASYREVQSGSLRSIMRRLLAGDSTHQKTQRVIAFVSPQSAFRGEQSYPAVLEFAQIVQATALVVLESAQDRDVQLAWLSHEFRSIGDGSPASTLDFVVPALLRATCLETPCAAFRHVDVSFGDIEPEELRGELLAAGPDVLRRRGRRWTVCHVEVDTPVSDTRIRQGGNYVVVGGGGALGQRVVAMLKAKKAGAIFILSRKAPQFQPAADSQVIHVAADVTVRAQVTNAFRRIIADRGGIHGVIHVAGVLSDCLAATNSPQRLDASLRPKLLGVRNLLEHRADIADFIICFSSIAALTGNFGQSNHAAANAALNAMAVSARSDASPIIISAIWDAWVDTQSITDVLANGQGVGGFSAASGELLSGGITEAQGQKFLEFLFSKACSAGLTLLSPRNLSEINEAFRQARLKLFDNSGGGKRSPSGLPNEVVSIQAAVLGAFASAFSDRNPGLHDDFYALGGHSLIAVQISRLLERNHGLNLPIRVIFQCRTPQAISDHLEGHAGSSNLAEASKSSVAEVVLPNGDRIKTLNVNEALHFYAEIYERHNYEHSNIAYTPGMQVVDAGANVGLFTKFVLKRAPNAKVLCIEPVTLLSELLIGNCRDARGEIIVENCALGAVDEARTFRFYPRSTGLSTLTPDLEREEALLRTVVANSENFGDQKCLEDVLQERLKSVEMEVTVKSLNSIVSDHGLDRIDLLKLDIQGEELPVLQSLSTGTWAKIRQIVVEVHHEAAEKAPLMELLIANGFSVETTQDQLYIGTNQCILYANRK